MSDLKSIPASEGAKAAAQIIEEDGAVVLKAAASPDEAAAAAAELERFLSRTPTSEGTFYGYSTRRCGALPAKSEHFADWAIHPAVLGAAETMLSPNCDSIQLNLTQAIRIEPGENPQFLHRDDELFPIPGPRFETMINAMWALSDFTAANGATRLIPGSHKWDRARPPEADRIVQAEMNPGDVLLYMGSVLHGGGANVSDGARTGAVVSYNLGWLKQTENFYLSVPWDRAASMTERLQRLLGYQLHKPNVGWVEGRDPLDWLRAGRPDVMAAADALTQEQIDMAADAMQHPERYAAYLS